MLAALLSVGHSFITSSAEPPKGKSITLGDLTFSDHGTKDVKGKGELELEADNYYFEPTFLRGAPGQKIKLEIENESGTLHNFSIPDQHLDVNIPPSGMVRFLQISRVARHEWRAADRRRQAPARLPQGALNKTSWFLLYGIRTGQRILQ